MNTRTTLRIDFEADRRDIRLSEGEAFFSVAKDPRRPFRVLSDSAEIRALGTQFSVYRSPERLVVTVVEGKVAAGNAHQQLELAAGDQGVIEAHTPTRAILVKSARVDAQRATSWRHNRLIFDNEPLSAVVAEFNRYNQRQMVIEDAALAAEGISGVFDPDKPQGLILFLSRKGGVTATERSDGSIRLTR
jgi:transmembrane sensor